MFASTKRTDGPTAVNRIVNSQEEFVGMADAPAPVGLASGPAAVRRIAADQEEECAGMGSALARLARAHGLNAMLVPPKMSQGQ